MQKMPHEKNEALTAATVRASSDVTQSGKKGSIMGEFKSVPADNQPVFSFGVHPVRVVVRDGEPWFIAADVCAVLGTKNHRESLRHLDDDEKGVISNDTHGGMQRISVVNESGLYALVLRSRKPEAKSFRKWVTSEVLPTIRKTGRYQSAPTTGRGSSSTCRGQTLNLQDTVSNLIAELEAPNGAPATAFMPLVNAVLNRVGLAPEVFGRTGALPESQAQEILVRLDRLGQLFHPLSEPFGDVLGVRRALRGLHPTIGVLEPKFRQVLPRLG